MAHDTDLRDSLPDPPPASPARRENAIEEAMRRFDGEPPSASPGSALPRREGWINRPQFGMLVTAGFVAVIGVPAAWLAVEQRNNERQTSLASTASDPAAASNSAAPQREASAAPPVTHAPALAERPTTGAVDAEPSATTESLPQKAVGAVQPRTDNRYASPRFAPVVPPPPIVAAPAAPPPPPPPTAVAAAAETASSAPVAARALAGDSIVVTGSRISTGVEQGDWNACTIDDPRRDLSICSQSLDVSAPGPDGAAAAHLADGLSRAWRGDLAGAIQSFDAAIVIAPKSADAYLNRSLAYARLGDEERALSDANKAVLHARDAARALYSRSVLLRRQGKLVMARKDERRAVALDPSYAAVIPR